VNRKTEKAAAPVRKPGVVSILLPGLLWGIAGLMLVLAAFLLVNRLSPAGAQNAQTATDTPAPTQTIAAGVSLPQYQPETKTILTRLTLLHTDTSGMFNTTVKSYTVAEGDALFSIASSFDLKPETLLYSNYDVLEDDPHTLSIGQVLTIPPVDGIYYKWQPDDTIQNVATRFKVDTSAILQWPGNNLDMTNPQIAADSYVMVPGGKREFKSWVEMTVWVPSSGTVRIISPGCVLMGNAYGTGSFMWPTSSHTLSGNDYWSGHLGIDIGTPTGEPIKAADSGVVVVAGWSTKGYGNYVMIDHGNGYHTLYAHLSALNVACGVGVYKGMTIGYAGSTGRSTGPHLHFEVRYNGAFVNPWTVLR
jgi:murein DD-endopeptidase MepM/ murein hydrolase activator NlpD